ncbi:MAG: hypothetical protein ACPGYX_06555 [Oceanobacter sp.]
MKALLTLASLLALGSAAEAEDHSHSMNHSMNHGTNHSMEHTHQSAQPVQASSQSHHAHGGHSMPGMPALTEAGNDAFGTLQEVIVALKNDPNTDWSRVDIEALRTHLIDMYEMTMNVDVVERRRIKTGSEVLIHPKGQRAVEAMKRVMDAHPAQLALETGWTMTVTSTDEGYLLRTTTKDLDEVDMIYGLGYIGLMAWGNHHQPHHWMMATGNNPHAH